MAISCFLQDHFGIIKHHPRKRKKNANAVEVRQVIYFNCVDFSDLGFFFQISMGHIVSFNFHQIYPTFKKGKH